MHVCISDADELSEKLTLFDEKLHKTNFAGLQNLSRRLDTVEGNIYKHFFNVVQGVWSGFSK